MVVRLVVTSCVMRRMGVVRRRMLGGWSGLCLGWGDRDE